MQSIDEFRKRYSFDINTPVGRGGFGEVYKGIDLDSGVEVAIKKSAVGRATTRYSLIQEFETGKLLNHPNLLKYYNAYRFTTTVGIFDFGVMEYVNGGDLDDFMRAFPSERQINGVLQGILSGMEYLHQLQIIHRDLKPANILINYEEGTAVPKIIDFGISKHISSEESMISNVVGSYEYMSPEQLGGSSNKIRYNSDLWTFGVVVYQLFTGELPFGSRLQGHTSGDIIRKVLDASTPDDINTIPQPYRTIIDACLIKSPDNRVASASQLLSVLRNQSDLSILKKPSSLSSLNTFDSYKPSDYNSTIPSPSVVESYPKARLGRRFAAYLLDCIFTVLLILPGSVLGGVVMETGDEDIGAGIIIITGVLPGLIYTLLKDGFNEGRSWGKQILGLRVVVPNKFTHCGFMRSFTKNLIFIVLSLVPYAIGTLSEVIVLLVNKQFRGLSELISNTQVIEERYYSNRK